MSARLAKPLDPQGIVTKLAEESHLPVDHVAALYASECARLSEGARITQYLHIFAVRHVQEILRSPPA